MTLGILPTMAPLHSACWPTTTFGLTLKVFSHRPKWGLMRREGLAHDDKRQDVEDEIGGQIVKVQPVVEHEPPDKRVEVKSQSTDEVGKKYHPLMGFWSRDDLPHI